MTIAERIVGALVALAPLEPADSPAWARWLSDPVTTRYLYGRRGPPDGPATLPELRSWGRQALADPNLVAFGIEEVGEGAVIGNARLQLWAFSRARFSILIGEAAHRGSGQGTEATALVCRYGFERLGLREIVLDVDPRNLAAVGAYRRVGFQHGRGDSMRLRPESVTYATAETERRSIGS
ncbi:MAG TPA: GNAT family protein [Gaiellales bacterium]|jgi:RimJ/RimL family protein N-acetyltransferase